MSDVIFLDEWTERHIELASWLSRMPLHSPYGSTCRRNRRPFVAGQALQWDADRAAVTKLSRLFASDGEAFKQVQSLLTRMPYVVSAVSLLARGDGLGAEHVAGLKRFVCFLLAQDQILAANDARPAFWDVLEAPSVLALFYGPSHDAQGHKRPGSFESCSDWEAQAVFALADVGSAPLLDAWAQVQSLRAQLDAARQLFTRALGQTYRTAIRRDQTLIVSADSELVADARADLRLALRMETPFEIVFDPVWPDSVRALQARTEAAIRVMAEAERIVLRDLSQSLCPYVNALSAWMRQVGELDEISARVVFASSQGCSWSLCGPQVRLQQALHPAVAGGSPLDFTLTHKVTVLLGPNMGGKTVAQKTLLFYQACHQFGLPVPGGDAVYEAPLFAALRYVGGDAQSLHAGLSSFGAEVIALQAALEARDVMLCCDELGRSTNPHEGQALVHALVDMLAIRPDCLALIATHFAIRADGCAYLKVSGIRATVDQWPTDLPVLERLAWLTQAMDYQLLPCSPDEMSQEGLRIAGWLGLSPALIARASAYSKGTPAVAIMTDDPITGDQ